MATLSAFMGTATLSAADGGIKRAEERASFALRGEVGYVVGPAKEHYRCLEVYDPKTNGTCITDTLEFFPEGFDAPT